MTRNPLHFDSAAGPDWRRWLLWLVLAAIGLGIGFGVPYLWVLDRRVTADFAQLAWQEPTRVLARPLRLYPGLAMDAQALAIELEAAAYRPAEEPLVPGGYRREGQRFFIHSRGFDDIDGQVAGRQIAVRLAGGRVAEVQDVQSGRALDEARLDPARIATLYGIVEEERRLLRLSQAPALLVAGVQAVEDREFKHHRGVDPVGVLRALWVDLRAGELRQGGSTLTQQLVRGLYLTRQKTLRRKIDEALYALIIEARFDKSRILEAYLNQVFMGQRGKHAVHGMGAAAEFWFGRDLDTLGTPEIALLVGLIKGPSYYDPRRHPQRARERRDLVLDAFAETGLIDAAALRKAKAAPLGVSPQPGMYSNRHPAFLELVRAQLESDYPAQALGGAGLSIHTTLAPSAQQLAEAAVARTLKTLAIAGRPPLQAGLVLTDTGSGEVRALIGDRDPRGTGFNRALEARRPVGSLLKPFVYLLALAQPGRYSLASWLDDAPVTVPLARGKQWLPENSDQRSHGRVRLIQALAQSYNQATVRLGLEIGLERLVRILNALGQVQAAPYPSLILGSVDLSPMAVAQLYQFLASGGQIQPLRAVRGVLDAQGLPLTRYDRAIEPAQPGDAIATRLIGLALQETVRNGTARSLLGAGLGSLQPAGKTGTSNDGRDSWFAGYTGEHLAAVWVGNDQNQATGLYGASGAMKVWSALFATLPSAPLRLSEQGLEWAWVDAEEYATTDEGCPGAERFAFVAGFGPESHVGCDQTLARLRQWFEELR